MPVSALILDYGEVMVRKQSAATVTRMAAAATLEPDEFARRYWAHRDAYDAGLAVADYWRRVLEGTAVAAHESTIAALTAADCASWTDYRDEVWDVAAAFRDRGGRTAMLSNGVPEIVAKVRGERPLERYFDVVVVSYEVGLAKPDPAIYRICLDRLDVPAEAALFVDDRVVNLEAAAQLGIQTLHFTGDESVAVLRERLL